MDFGLDGVERSRFWGVEMALGFNMYVPDLPKISYIILGILVKLKTYSLVRVYWKVCCSGLSVWCFGSVQTGLFQSLNPKPA